VCTSSISLKQ